MDVTLGGGWRLGEAPVDAADPTVRAAPVAKVAVSSTPFVGREALLVEISARFEGGWRVVALRGPAGVGETRATLEAARAWPGELLPLAAKTAPLLVIDGAVAALEVVAEGLAAYPGKRSTCPGKIKSGFAPITSRFAS